MNSHAKSSDLVHIDEFRNAHKIWKEANDRFHERFEDIIARGRSHDLDALAQDFLDKFEHFMQCSKALVTGK